MGGWVGGRRRGREREKGGHREKKKAIKPGRKEGSIYHVYQVCISPILYLVLS